MEWDGPKLINGSKGVVEHKALEQPHASAELKESRRPDEDERFQDAEQFDDPNKPNIFDKLSGSNEPHKTDRRDDSEDGNESTVPTVVINDSDEANEPKEPKGPAQSAPPQPIVERMQKSNAEKAAIRQVVDEFFPPDPFTWQSPTVKNSTPCFCDYLDSLTHEGFHRLATFCLGTGPILDRGRHIPSFASEIVTSLSPGYEPQKRKTLTSTERVLFDRVASKHHDLKVRVDKRQFRPLSGVGIDWNSDGAFCWQREILTTVSKHFGCEIQWDDDQSIAVGENERRTVKKANEDDQPLWGDVKSSARTKVEIDSDDETIDDNTEVEKHEQLDEKQITTGVKAGVKTKVNAAKDAEKTANGIKTSISRGSFVHASASLTNSTVGPLGFSGTPQYGNLPSTFIVGPTKMVDIESTNTIVFSQPAGLNLEQESSEGEVYVLNAVAEYNTTPGAVQKDPEQPDITDPRLVKPIAAAAVSSSKPVVPQHDNLEAEQVTSQALSRQAKKGKKKGKGKKKAGHVF
ncbi:hypothetical protein DE146DRAFT_217006 [Phaeosphaeria sp. MPI-PUGE-AT-0046c]|nr:hypothetical protein DE146DRAFT_217006 [Phaeosphaeria sp. MPI-PUGE-AT-0046c]